MVTFKYHPISLMIRGMIMLKIILTQYYSYYIVKDYSTVYFKWIPSSYRRMFIITMN